MNELVKIDQLDLSNIPSEDREIILASEKTMIKDMNNKDLVLEMNTILLTTFFESGQSKLDDSDQTTLLMIVCHDLLRDFKYITLDEIKIAYRKGVRGQYDKYYGLSPVTYYNWVKKYIEESRSEAMRLKKEAMGKLMRYNSQSPPPSQEEWNRIMYGSCLELFERFKENKLRKDSDKVRNDDVGNIHFNFLNKQGLIPMWDDSAIKEKLKIKLDKMKDQMKLKKDFDNFLNSISQASEEKKIILEEFFNSLIKEGKDLKPLLDEKLKQ